MTLLGTQTRPASLLVHALILALAASGLMAGSAVAQTFPVNQPQITISPANPTTSDIVSITIRGTHPNGCVPMFDSGGQFGSEIRIFLTNSSGPCTQALTDYTVGPLSLTNPLPAGQYQVVLFLNGSSFGSPQSFTVTSGGGGGGSTPTIEISPPSPTTKDIVSITIRGTHPDSCVPRFDSGTFGNFVITIFLASPPPTTPCSQAVTPYVIGPLTLSAPLPAGQHEVRLALDGFPFGNPKSFTVTQAQTQEIRFSRSMYSVNESDNAVLVSIERVGGSTGSASVRVSTRNGSARAGQDYDSLSQTVVWGPGDSTPKQVPLMIIDDSSPESDETFEVVLSSPTGAVLGQPSVSEITIVDDDQVTFGGPCVAGPTTLCLNNDRFRVRTTWRTSSDSGTGDARNLTQDSGFFTFFDPNNAEVLVKVLDACVLSDTYWVFIGGLTDVFVEITVEDLVTGEVRRWTNPQGRDFLLVKEFSFFRDSCP